MSSPNECPSLWTLDRIEEGVAVMISDQGQRTECPAPAGGAEGDVFRREGDAFVFLPGETAQRKRRIRSKMDSIFRKNEPRTPDQ